MINIACHFHGAFTHTLYIYMKTWLFFSPQCSKNSHYTQIFMICYSLPLATKISLHSAPYHDHLSLVDVHWGGTNLSFIPTFSQVTCKIKKYIFFLFFQWWFIKLNRPVSVSCEKCFVCLVLNFSSITLTININKMLDTCTQLLHQYH